MECTLAPLTLHLQDRLLEMTEAIGTRLEYFQELEHATRMLNHPGESLVLQTDFLYMVERVDICIDYLKAHVGAPFRTLLMENADPAIAETLQGSRNIPSEISAVYDQGYDPHQDVFCGVSSRPRSGCHEAHIGEGIQIRILVPRYQLIWTCI